VYCIIFRSKWVIGIGSIHDQGDTRVLRAGATGMFSLLQSQNLTEDLEEMSLHIRDSRVTKFIQEASENIKSNIDVQLK
jgi:hypothetical protein